MHSFLQSQLSFFCMQMYEMADIRVFVAHKRDIRPMIHLR